MSKLRLVVPTSVAAELSTEPGLVVEVADRKEHTDFEFGLAETAAVVTVVLGTLTAAEKILSLAKTIKKAATRRQPKVTILVRGRQDDIGLNIDDDTSIDELARLLRDHIEE